jgi:hypothetical protein
MKNSGDNGVTAGNTKTKREGDGQKDSGGRQYSSHLFDTLREMFVASCRFALSGRVIVIQVVANVCITAGTALR